MSETKWTPGPWSVDRYGVVLDGVGRTLLVSGVAIPGGNHSRQREAEANARLLVAAPDLYAAGGKLREAQRAYMADRGNDALGRAVSDAAAELDAALAKARGEGLS